MMRRALITAAQVLTVAAVLWLWQTVSRSQASLVSRPGDIARSFGHWLATPVLRDYIPVTLEEAGLGLLLAVTGAMILAAALTWFSFMADVCTPFVAVLNAAPKIALAPLFLLAFGLGTSSKVYFVAASVFFIPFYSLLAALRAVDRSYLDNMRVLGASRLSLLREVYIPSIVPVVTASLRISATFSLLAAVISEMIASQKGIGFQILNAQGNFENNYVMAGVLIVALLAFILDRGFVLAERRLMRWKYAK